jgi:hypothetical protein
MLKRFGGASAEEAERYAKAQYKIFDKARRAEWKQKALVELNAAASLLPRSRKKKPS